MMLEKRGVDTIPDEERTSHPRDLISMLIGSNLCLGVIVFGWLPVSFGLGFWPAVTSVITGTVIGALIVAPLALISLNTATNLSTSSGAAFGVRGRLIGSALGLMLALGYITLTLWTGGDVIVGCMERLGVFSTHSFVYALLSLCTVTFAIFGYRWLLSLSQFLAFGMFALLMLGVFAYAPSFSLSAPSNYFLGDFWSTWLLSVVSAGLSGPIAFITLLGDYTRYISPIKHSSNKVLKAAAAGLILGLLIPQLFGTFLALAANDASDFASSLVAASPSWYLFPLLIAATAGSIGNAGVMLYSMGLDLDAIMPRSTRTQATLAVSALTTLFVYLGHFAWNAQEAMTSFVLLLTAIGTPWAVIILLNHFRNKGVYDSESLQIFNQGKSGGIYWYNFGWNFEAAIAWILGSVMGLLSVSTPLFEGPLVWLTGRIDVSFILSGLSAGGMYAALQLRRKKMKHKDALV